MNITVITEPPFEPITLADCYAHLRLDPEGSPPEHLDDAMLTRQIASARRFVEQATRRALVKQTIRMSTSDWPCETRPLRLYRPPVIAVQSVQFYDGDGVLVTLDPSQWFLTDEPLPSLRGVSGAWWPTAYCRPDAIRVTYTAGYPPAGSPPATQEDYAAAVPQDLKDAMLLQVQLLYDQVAPDQRAALERTRDALLSPYRVLLV